MKGGESCKTTLGFVQGSECGGTFDGRRLVRIEATWQGPLTSINLVLALLVSGKTKCIYPGGIGQWGWSCELVHPTCVRDHLPWAMN